MQKNKYIVPSVEVLGFFVESGIMLAKSDKDTTDNLTKKRGFETTNSSSIWGNSINNQE